MKEGCKIICPEQMSDKGRAREAAVALLATAVSFSLLLLSVDPLIPTPGGAVKKYGLGLVSLAIFLTGLWFMLRAILETRSDPSFPVFASALGYFTSMLTAFSFSSFIAGSFLLPPPGWKITLPSLLVASFSVFHTLLAYLCIFVAVYATWAVFCLDRAMRTAFSPLIVRGFRAFDIVALLFLLLFVVFPAVKILVDCFR